jgi:hypothetical protein
MAGSVVEFDRPGPESIPIERVKPWAVNNDEDDGSTAVLHKSAPDRAGAALYVTHVTFSKQTAASDIAVTVEDEDENVYYGPIYLVDNGQGNFSKDFEPPLKLPDNKDLYVQGVGGKGSALTIYIEGFTGDKPLG